MPQPTKSKQPHWHLLKQVLLPPRSNRCYSHLNLRHFSSTSTRPHPMWRMQSLSTARPSFRPPSPPLTPRCLSLTTTLWISCPPIISSLPKRTQGWHPNWQWHKLLLYPIHRGQPITLLLLLPGSHVINCHCSKHRYPRLRGQVRATIRGITAVKSITIHTH